jgi:Fe-S oxidoreductase
MCNNNGACRALGGGVMCPSYRVTRDERDVTRGRANTLRLAITGQLGPDALVSDEMADTLELCVSCKACRRECPTGVDMARMKIEVQAARAAARGLTLHDRLVGYLPRYAPLAARFPALSNARNRMPLLAQLMERRAGFSAQRKLPAWRKDFFREPNPASSPGLSRRSTSSNPALPQDVDAREKPGHDGGEAVFFVDTFNRYFEPENVQAALAVLSAAGCRVHLPRPADGSTRPLCCGRTFLSVGLVDQAKREAERCLAALGPFASRGVPVVGLEPSCMLGFRDEIPALLKTEDARRLASRVLMFEEFVTRGIEALPLAPIGPRALVHGHCHQKSFAVMDTVEAALRRVPDLAVEMIESSCCGMAGAFGYGADTVDVSLKMGELSLLPAVRAASEDAIIVADGTSCRQQIAHGTGREALHVARVLAMSIAAARASAPATPSSD